MKRQPIRRSLKHSGNGSLQNTKPPKDARPRKTAALSTASARTGNGGSEKHFQIHESHSGGEKIHCLRGEPGGCDGRADGQDFAARISSIAPAATTPKVAVTWVAVP